MRIRMELITKKSKEIISFFNGVQIIRNSLKRIQEFKAEFSGERYFTDKQLSKKLNISRRTLQDYRTQGKIPYIHLNGKVLYRESDVIALLERFYVEAWKTDDS